MARRVFRPQHLDKIPAQSWGVHNEHPPTRKMPVHTRNGPRWACVQRLGTPPRHSGAPAGGSSPGLCELGGESGGYLFYSLTVCECIMIHSLVTADRFEPQVRRLPGAPSRQLPVRTSTRKGRGQPPSRLKFYRHTSQLRPEACLHNGTRAAPVTAFTDATATVVDGACGTRVGPFGLKI